MEKRPVAVILSADKDVVNFIGYGNHVGGFPPKIELNEGGIIYGHQCYWMDEEMFWKFVGNRKINTVENPNVTENSAE